MAGNLSFVSVTGGNNGASITDGNVLNVTAGGTYTIICTTNTWGETARVTITEQGYDNSVTVNGGIRNYLSIPKTKVTNPTNPNKNYKLSVTYQGNTGNERSITTKRDNRTYYIEGEIDIADIPSSDTGLTFSYSSKNITYSATVSAGDLVAGRVTIDLKK